MSTQQYLLFLIIGISTTITPAFAEPAQCYISILDRGIGAAFIMKDIDKEWHWLRNPRTEMYTEYQWLLEPGHLIDADNFVAHQSLAGYSIGSFHAGGKLEKKGRIEKLLEDGWGGIYYRSSGDREILDTFEQHIDAQRKLNSVILLIKSKAARDILMKEKPTHFRMTFSSIEKSNNYTCIIKARNSLKP